MSKAKSSVKDLKVLLERLNQASPGTSLTPPPLQIEQQHHHPRRLHLPDFLTHRHHHRTRDRPDAPMLPKRVPLPLSNPVKPSIDSVIHGTGSDADPLIDPAEATSSGLTAPTSPVPLPRRPGASPRPSWIGPKPPDRSNTPGVPAMKQTVTVDYASPGLQPPVFIFTDLSEPSWAAVEMEATQNEGGEYRFGKVFSVEGGEYQYKFRLGPGDWWACDNSKPVVDDGQGNKNNLLVVKDPSQPPVAPMAKLPEMRKTLGSSGAQSNLPIQAPEAAQATLVGPPQSSVATPSPTSPVTYETNARTKLDDKPAPAIGSAASSTLPQLDPTFVPGPLMPHETFPRSAPATGRLRLGDDPVIPVSSEIHAEQHPASRPVEEPVSAPLMSHEKTMGPSSPTNAKKDKSEPPDEWWDDDAEECEPEDPPLLRHESLTPHAAEETHSPLFRHESIALGEHLEPLIDSLQPLTATSTNPSDSVAPEVDPDDPSLEAFPEDHAGIMEVLHRASTMLPEDTAADSVTSPPSSVVMSETSMSPVPQIEKLHSVQESDEEELERTRQIEEKEAELEEEDLDPLRDIPPETEPAIIALITPPMTPKEAEELVEEILVEEAERTAEREAWESLDNNTAQGKSSPAALSEFWRHPVSWMAAIGIAVVVGAWFYKSRSA